MSQREACGVPAGSLQIEIDGVRLAVAREGRGPPVVCLHALGHGGGDFEAFTEQVRERHEVIRVDWPGQGRSAQDGQPASAARYAELLVALLDRLQLPAPILLGNSIGAAAALLYADQRPARALVLCDAGGLVPVGGPVRLLCRAFAGFFAAGERGAAWFAPAFAFYYRHLILPAPEAAAQRQRIIDAGAEVAAVLRQGWQSFARPEADLRALAAALDLPIWCAWARRDRVIPLWLCRPALRRLRHAALSRFDGGHAPFLEQPLEFAAAFLQFSARLAPADGDSPTAHIASAA